MAVDIAVEPYINTNSRASDVVSKTMEMMTMEKIPNAVTLAVLESRLKRLIAVQEW